MISSVIAGRKDGFVRMDELSEEEYNVKSILLTTKA
jgi:hypothetical protein